MKHQLTEQGPNFRAGFHSPITSVSLPALLTHAGANASRYKRDDELDFGEQRRFGVEWGGGSGGAEVGRDEGVVQVVGEVGKAVT